MSSALVKVVCMRCGDLILLASRSRDDDPNQIEFKRGSCRKCYLEITEEMESITKGEGPKIPKPGGGREMEPSGG